MLKAQMLPLAGRLLTSFLWRFLGVGFVAFFVFSPALINRFALHDNFMHFKGIQDPQQKRDCSTHGQYKHIQSIGRPIVAYFECLVYKNVNSYSDLQHMRWYVVVLISLFGAALWMSLLRLVSSEMIAAALTMAIVTAPSFQHAVNMVSLGNNLAYLSALWSAMILLEWAPRRQWLQFAQLALSAGLLGLTFYSYQVATFFFFIPFLIKALWSPNTPPLRKLVALPLLQFAVVGLFYYKNPFLFSPEDSSLGNMYKVSSDLDLWGRFINFHLDPLVNIFNFWFVSGYLEVAKVLMTASLALFVTMFVLQPKVRKKLLLATVFFYLSAGAYFIYGVWSFRIMTPAICALIVVIYFLLFSAVTSLYKIRLGHWEQTVLPGFLIFTSVAAAHMNTLFNVSALTIELGVIRHILASAPQPLRHIHVIDRKPDDFVFNSMYGIYHHGDTDHLYHVQHNQNFPMIVYSLVHELFPGQYNVHECLEPSIELCISQHRHPPSTVFFTRSTAGQPYCVYNHTTVMNTYSIWATFDAFRYLEPKTDRVILADIERDAKKCPEPQWPNVVSP